MAGQEIKYKVSVDSSRANRALDQFGRAAQDAGRTAISALDDTASAGDQARAALEAMAQAMESEMKDAAQAAEALAKALGPELAARMDPAAVVADLNKMGVGFDEIRADADKFADTLKKINTVDLSPTTSEVDNLGTHLDTTHDEADQSRSVLANMSGNAAGELAEVAGATGPLNVALGQLAEYATEGNIKMSNLATVAGPMAVLGLAVAGVTQFMKEQQRIDAWRTEQVEGYAAAVDKVGVGLGAIEEHLSNVAAEKFETATGITEFLLGGDTVENMAASFGVMGINIHQVSEAIAAGASDTDAGKKALDDLEQQLIDAGYSSGLYSVNLKYLREQQDAYAKATANAAGENKFYAATVGDINSALQANSDELNNQKILWDFILDDLKDGKADTGEAASAWNQLKTALGLTDDQMTELAQQKLDEKLAADEQAAAGLAEQVRAVRDAAADYNRTVQSADFGAAAFEGATTAAQGFFDLQLTEESQIADSQAAYDDLAESVDGLGTTYMDLNSPEGRQTFGLLKQLGSTIVPKVAQAFDEADGDLDQFKANMHVVGEETITGLIGSFTDLGYSESDARDMANDLMIQLGLIPENVETLYKLAGTEEAKLQLGLLQGTISTLTQPQQIHIATLITHGDYVGARDYLESIMGPPVTVKIQPEIDWYAVSQEKGKLQNAFSSGIKVTVSPRSAGPSSSAAAAPMTAATRGVAPAAMAAPVPVTVNVRAAVIGNRFDVERVVAGAVRNAVRIAGRRQLAGVA